MSLYTTGFFIRRYIIIFAVFIGFLVSIGIIGTIIKNLADSTTIIQQEKPSLGYGTINAARLLPPTGAETFKPKTFTLDTPAGALPSFSESFKKADSNTEYVNVYKVDVPAVQADSKQIGLDLGKELGFTADTKENNLKYEWTDGKRSLTYFIDSKTFYLYTNNIASIDKPSERAGTIDEGQNFFKNLITKVKLNVSDPLGYFKSEYVKYNTATSQWELSPENKQTNFVRISYMRYSRTRGNEILPMVLSTSSTDFRIVKESYPDYDFSPMYMVIKNTVDIKPADIVEMKFNKFDYDITRPQTYYPKPIQTAYNELTNGQGYLVAVRSKLFEPLDATVLSGITEFRIKSVELSYLFSGTKAGYVLPVYVFKGEFVISRQGITQRLGEAIYYVYAFTN